MKGPATDRELLIWAMRRDACREGLDEARLMGVEKMWKTTEHPEYVGWVIATVFSDNRTINRKVNIALRKWLVDNSDLLLKTAMEARLDDDNMKMIVSLAKKVSRKRWSEIDRADLPWEAPTGSGTKKARNAFETLYTMITTLAGRDCISGFSLAFEEWDRIPVTDFSTSITKVLSDVVPLDAVRKEVGNIIYSEMWASFGSKW